MDVMFMLPNVNLAIMDSVTIIFMLLKTVITANFQCNVFIGCSFFIISVLCIIEDMW